MDSEVAPTGSAGSRWTSARAVTAYVVIAALVVVASFWAARAGAADRGVDPAPSGSPAASSVGTPRITVAMTPTWESHPQSMVTGPAGLVAEPAALAAPVVLAGAPETGGYARLDPTDGTWLWRRSTHNLPFLGWAGSNALFGGPGDLSPTGRARWTVDAVSPRGDPVFSTPTGRYVTSTATRVLLQQGRLLTALTPEGRLAWQRRLPAGVKTAGHVVDETGPGLAFPDEVAFVSTGGPGRVVAVDLVDGGMRDHRVEATRPQAWATSRGVVAADPGRGTITRYDRTGAPVWTRDAVQVLSVAAGWVLVTGPASEDVSLLRLEDGSSVWTSEPLDGRAVSGDLTVAAGGPVLVELAVDSDSGPVTTVLAADPPTGEQLWAVDRRNLLGVWHGFAIFAAVDGRALSALDLRNGITLATLNASTVVDPQASVIVGSTLVYLDRGTGTAHGVSLVD